MRFINPTLLLKRFTFACSALVFVMPSLSGELVKVPTRPDINTNVFWHQTEGAVATLLVFPGGGGGFGKVMDGWPGSGNFLVRSSRQWAAQGYNLAVFGRPSDSEELGYEDRISALHMQDVNAVVQWVKQQSASPIWVIGTSRGTISAAAMLINVPDPQIAGGVLTSSVVNFKKAGAVPKQDLAKIKVPVLVYHHQNDGCELCRPYEVPAVIHGLKAAPVKKLMMVSGGGNPVGPACEGQHYHGFIGMETQAVADIAAWMKSPAN
jgi:dienelactone hydrolase